MIQIDLKQVMDTLVFILGVVCGAWLFTTIYQMNKRLKKIQECVDCKLGHSSSGINEKDIINLMKDSDELTKLNRKLLNLLEQDAHLSKLINTKEQKIRDNLYFNEDAVREYLKPDTVDDITDEVDTLTKILAHAIMEEHISQFHPIHKVFKERNDIWNKLKKHKGK